MLRLFSVDSNAIQNSPWAQQYLSSLSQSTPCWTASHVSMRLVFVSDSFIPKGPLELLWLVQAHRPVFGSVKLAPIKYEKSFVPRHMKSDEGLFWKSTDHSAITLSINGIDVSKRDPSFWKFNCSLVNDNNYCDLLDTNIKSWLEEFKDVVDKRVLWDLLKYKSRQLTINYSKTKARNRTAKVNELEEKLRNCTKKCDNDPWRRNVEDLECLQAEYDQMHRVSQKFVPLISCAITFDQNFIFTWNF